MGASFPNGARQDKQRPAIQAAEHGWDAAGAKDGQGAERAWTGSGAPAGRLVGMVSVECDGGSLRTPGPAHHRFVTTHDDRPTEGEGRRWTPKTPGTLVRYLAACQ